VERESADYGKMTDRPAGLLLMASLAKVAHD
jgi:hypothetical protein